MKIDLNILRDKVEATALTARATIIPAQNQIIVSFSNRPDVEIALLTPYNQMQIKNGKMSYNDLAELLRSIRSIANAR